MTEVFEFPIQNPILLLPLMAVHGVFKTDLISELLGQVSPNQYKSFRGICHLRNGHTMTDSRIQVRTPTGD